MKYIEQLMEVKPQCPVLFSEIQVNYTDPKERYLNTLAQAEADDVFPLFTRVGPIHIPLTDFTGIPDDHRSYIYPACGHVYGYHRSLEENPCPLCRQKGPYVPIAIACEPTLTNGPLTHVFNPCGHVASWECCAYWGNLIIFPKHNAPLERVAICPFCATELSDEKPYCKLIFPTGKVQDEPEEEGNSLISRDYWYNEDFQQCLFDAQKTWFHHHYKRNLGNSSPISPHSRFPFTKYPVYAPQLEK